MKRQAILIAVGFCLYGCSSAPTDEQAIKIISAEFNLPRTVDFDLFRADPKHANKVLDVGLESEGYVLVKRTRKLSEVVQPLIDLSAKANPYLLMTSETDRRLNIQKLRVATEEISNVSNVKTEGNRATVDYTTNYKSTTPFIVLLSDKALLPRKHRVYLVKNGSDWIVEK